MATKKQMAKRQKQIQNGFSETGFPIIEGKANLPFKPLFMGNGVGTAYVKNNRIHALHFGLEAPENAKILETSGYEVRTGHISQLTINFN